jgi:hypothetical protein
MSLLGWKASPLSHCSNSRWQLVLFVLLFYLGKRNFYDNTHVNQLDQIGLKGTLIINKFTVMQFVSVSTVERMSVI